MKKIMLQKGNIRKLNLTALQTRTDAGEQTKKQLTPTPPATSHMKNEYSSLKEAALSVQRIRLAAQRELEMTRKMRADAQKYQQETATRARSEAQQLILHTRLATQRDIEELIRKASEEIQKVLADIRVIRIIAQEELAAQRKFTDAARLSTMSLAIKGNYKKPETKKPETKKPEAKKSEGKKKKQLVTAK